MRLWGRGEAVRLSTNVVGRITREPIADVNERADWIPFGTLNELQQMGSLENYPAVLCLDRAGSVPPAPGVYAPANLDFIGERDVVSLAPDGGVRVWYRRASENNTLLVTEQCNSYCLMCSQPPKAEDDSARIPLLLRLIELIDPAARELVISGGEPTIAGDGFFSIIGKLRDYLPCTAVHVLTNGRNFKDESLAARLAAVRHPDLMLGIPLYSDIDRRHDYVVQAEGAYGETLHGFYNLAAHGVRLELRVVLHKQTIPRLPQLAEFIARNLPFVEHVALMGLEMYGFTPRNLDVLWIDPVEYQRELGKAVETLALSGMNVSIYNHQLCTLPMSLWPFARKSISDWKNVYLPECAGCGVQRYCGGFFQSAAKRHSGAVSPLTTPSSQAEMALNALLGGGSAALQGSDHVEVGQSHAAVTSSL
jgi:His-Xaa-Ser system radical SAM maturase HxsC